MARKSEARHKGMLAADLPVHGGDLAEAEALRAGLTGEAADPHAPWLDLSTGINPWPHPLPEIGADAWRALPSRRELDALLDAARACYRVPSKLRIVAAPGSEALIHLLPTLFDPAPAAIVSPTYGEHERSWAQAGHDVRAVDNIGAALAAAGNVVLVNPNNPDGRRLAPEEIAALAEGLAKAGRWLIVDEAFGDLDPHAGALASAAPDGLVVLRSFGKFFGLAGLRLGFAIAPRDLAARIEARLGSWAVSGPAIAVARAALGDVNWQRLTRDRLEAEAARLDRLLEAGGLEIIGGTALFRLAAHERAAELFADLLAARIYVRRFAHDPRWLRFGLPACAADSARLGAVLAGFAAGARR